MNTYNYQISPAFDTLNVRFPENLITLNLNLTRSNLELKLKPAQIFDTTDEYVICYGEQDMFLDFVNIFQHVQK